MSEEEGFTRSYRRKWRNPIFRNLRDAGIWSWMTDTAAWRQTRIRFGEALVSVERGQLVTSERFMAEGFCVDRQVIRRLLDTLEREHMITRQKTHGGTIITICNYEKYQGFENGENPAVGPEQTQDEPSENPNKKEGNKENIPPISPKADETPSGWDEFWSLYPRKTARPAALKAYRGAVRKASPETILAGLGAALPHFSADIKWVAHPTTWLNQERWADHVAEVVPHPAMTAGPDAEWIPRIDGWRSKRFWIAIWGPKPGERGCRIPASILREYGFEPAQVSA